MSHSAEKCKRGDPLGFINIYSVAKYQKTRKGDSFKTLKKNSKKVEQCRKKLKGVTLCTKFALAGFGLSSFISFCKKWYIRDEVCGLTKKKEEKKLATVSVGHFSLEKRRLKMK